ncbi:MAG: ABC transporter permease [Gammaproteobacteria bacterium]
MSAFRQTLAVTGMNLRSIPARYGTSLVIVIGIATVVAVLVSVLAMSQGFLESVTRSGRAERAIVLGRGATSESSAGFSRDNAVTILNSPGIRKGADGSPVASAEYLASVLLPADRGGNDAFIIVRGVGQQAFELRPEMKLVEGRVFKAGLNEMIAGRAAQVRLGGVKVGSHVAMPNGDWTVTGIFESNGDSHESEFFTDADTLIAAMRRGQSFSSTTVWLEDSAAYTRFKDAVTTNPTLSVDVKPEPEYFEATARPLTQILNIVAYVIGGFMALGAVFGALNTMYSAISARAVEIATLRAIGFGSGAVVVSVFVEAVLLASVGAVLGSAVAWLFFDGNLVSTASTNSRSQLTFALSVTPGLIAVGATFALAIGVLGGLFPAIRAARRPVAVALRG